MKKYVLLAFLALGSTATVTTSLQSCGTVLSSGIGLNVLKNILLGGITKGMGIFGNLDSFLSNALIDAAMPQQLRDINNTLEKIGLSSVVQKEREYIAKAAAFTIDISKPILVNAVNSLTAEDALRIAQGGKGAATQILRQKTEAQLIAAIMPKVDSKLNEFGVVKMLNTALSGSNILGQILGTGSSTSATSGVSNLAAQQMVKGLFNIIENHEVTSPENPLNILR